ncbi:hypothetical protein [Flavobacterium quisquiliarum]|uniref:Uncharacterized protein n=1 Tax=Flavobacterium quisquiliarum TaxID=1834436 RepID=A0ABV8W5L0_9FLAO
MKNSGSLGKTVSIKPSVYLKPTALALMGATSFCCGVHSKRYSGQQE